MRVLIEVDGPRRYLGSLTARLDDGSEIGPVDVCVTADEAAARTAGNPQRDPLRPAGHAPFGSYRLREVRAVPAAAWSDYGRHSLVFEPRSGEALDSESFGRLALALHGGALDENGELRPTDGGFRVEDDVLARLAAVARPGDVLELREKPLGFWERLFGHRRRPGEERSRRSADPDPVRSDRSPSSSESFEGRGGTFGGAGASGAWDASPAAGAAAAAGVAGALAASQLGGEAAPAGDAEPPESTTGASLAETTTSY